MKRHFTIYTALLIALIVSVPMFAQIENGDSSDAQMYLDLRTVSWGGFCDQGGGKILAGARLFVQISNPRDMSLESPGTSWPEEYTLHAALDLNPGSPFSITPGLIERMNAAYFLGIAKRMAAQHLLKGDMPLRDDYIAALNAKEFAVTIPEDLAGHTITIRARYERDGIEILSNAVGPLRVIGPCDVNDSSTVMATRVYEVGFGGNHAGVLVLVDSMLASGLSNAHALSSAWKIARARQEYDRALSYLEQIYTDFGVTAEDFNTTQPHRIDRRSARTTQQQEIYTKLRDDLMRSKLEHEQQQR